MKTIVTRREFVRTAALGGAGLLVLRNSRHAFASDEVLKLADEALYISKHKGKNQVSVAKAWG